MNSYDKFQTEFDHLEMLLASTLYAYDETILSSTQSAKDGHIDRKKPFFRTLVGGNEFKLANTLKQLHSKYRKDFRTILRETIFVRSISVLEVFLIDTVREILLVRKDLLLNIQNIKISYPHLLSFKNASEILTYIINKECRSLQSGGFLEITKYFRNRLKIEFNNFTEPIRLIFEYHDKRHLIVHRLGLTDREYRHKYATKDKKINISEKYLISSFKVVRAFCDFVLKESQQLINSVDSFHSQSDDSFVRIAVKPLDKKGLTAINKGYIFSFDDNVIQLKDLSLQSIKATDDSYNLSISGDISFLKRYIAILKKLEINKSLEIINIELTEVKQSKRKRKKIPISNEIFAKIKNHVPPQPWEKGMHKIIASKLGVSNKIVQAVIRKLISEGVFKDQIDGIIIE